MSEKMVSELPDYDVEILDTSVAFEWLVKRVGRGEVNVFRGVSESCISLLLSEKCFMIRKLTFIFANSN